MPTEPALANLLARIRTRPARQSDDYAQLAAELTAEPLVALVRSLASHHWTTDLGPFEGGPEPLAGNGFEDEIREALRAAGHAEDEAITLGNTGGGEETLLLVASGDEPGGYVLYRFALDGAPYSGGETLLRLGQLGDFVRDCVDREDDIAPELLELVGLSPEEPEPAATATVVAPGTVELRPVDDEPVEMTLDERREAFRPVHEHTELRDAIRVVFRTARGRIAAMVAGRLQGKYRKEQVLLDPDGSVRIHETDAGWLWTSVHPTQERALINDGESLMELDLDSLDRVALGPSLVGTSADYFVDGGVERVMAFDKDAMVMRIWAHEPMKPLGGSPLAEVSCGGAWYKIKVLGGGRFLRGSESGYELVQLRNEGPDSIAIDVAPLSAPGVDDLENEDAQLSSRRVGSQTYIRLSIMRDGKRGTRENFVQWFAVPD